MEEQNPRNRATKSEGLPTLEKAAPDEPLFVLRAHDELAPEIVREWARLARHEGVDAVKIVDALNVADRMEEWQVEHGKKRPD